jgi:hypothetical protein
MVTKLPADFEINFIVVFITALSAFIEFLLF